MDRRGFLAALLAGATIDPDRLLWKPKLISIPRPTSGGLFNPHAGLEQMYALHLRVIEQLAEQAEADVNFYRGTLWFHRDAFVLSYPRIGDTINVRRPARFTQGASA